MSRYGRSLGLLLAAIRETDRTYIFDNSGENRERVWVAEVTGGRLLELKTDHVPSWFKRTVMDNILA